MYIRGLYQYGKEYGIMYTFLSCIYLVFNMQKCMDGVNQDCIAANPSEEWKCFMAQVSDTPINYVITPDLQLTILVHLPSHQDSNILTKCPL